MANEDEFVAAELYDPAMSGADERLALLQWLDEHGFTIEEMRRVHIDEPVGLTALASDHRMRGGDARPLEAGLEGHDLDQIQLVAATLGLTPLTHDGGELAFTDAEVETIRSLGALSELFSEAESLATIRVIGSAMARIGEAAVSVFLHDVEAPYVRDNGSEFEHAQRSYEAAGLLEADFGSALQTLLRRHTLQAIDRTRRTSIDAEERFDYRFAVGFVDLVGFTALSGEMSPQELGVFVRDFEARAHDAVAPHEARVVKLIGDEVMYVSTNANDACRAGAALMAAVSSFGDGIVPRGGLAYGNVLLQGGDYYGPVVNLAARLVDQAVPEELLVTQELAETAAECEFEPAGRRMVKGFEKPIAVAAYLGG